MQTALDRAAVDRPAIVLLAGAAGVGKTRLLDSMAASVDPDVRVFRVTGDEFEQNLDFASFEPLARLGGSVGDFSFARSQRRPSPKEVGEALIDDFRKADARRILLLVDDAHWIDQPSLQALAYAVRRAAECSVGAVVAFRSGLARLEAFERFENGGGHLRLELRGLAVEDVQRLMLTRGLELTHRAAIRLHQHTDGNPFHILALALELDAEELARGFGPVPAPRGFATVVLSGLAATPLAVQEVVSIAAILGMPASILTLAEIADVDDPLGAVDDAVARGLLTRTTRGAVSSVDVAHPLIRSAVCADMPLARRADLHRRAADVVADPTRKMIHRISAATKRDSALAAEAVALALNRNDNGWAYTAVEFLTGAAELFAADDDRAEALHLASDILLTMGEVRWAETLLAAAGERSGNGAAENLVRGHLALLSGDAERAGRTLRRAWDAAPSPRIAARVAGLLATVAANWTDGRQSAMWARRALDLGGRDTGGGDPAHAATMLASAYALQGDLAAGRVQSAAHLARRVDTPGEADARLANGVLALWDGSLAEAIVDLSSVVEGGERQVALTTASARYALADALYRQGAWDASLQFSEVGIADLGDSGSRLAAPMVLAVGSFIPSARGQWEQAEERLNRADEAIAQTSNEAARLWAAVGRARLGLARNAHDEVVAALAPLAALLDNGALPEGVLPWRADLIEAFVALGRLTDAGQALVALESRLIGGGAHGHIGAARARGLLAAAHGDFARAAAAFGSSPQTGTGAFAAARLQFAWGAFERRRGHRRRAAERLERALATFTRLGAEPFADRARAELELCGASARTVNSAGMPLTPGELAVARFVARGDTNREVGSQLSISVKTVEAHLSRIYAKLQIRSRTELAALGGRFDMAVADQKDDRAKP